MHTDPREKRRDFKQLAQQIRADRDSIPLEERRELVAAIRETLEDCPVTHSVLQMVHLLADDPRWEVRQDVANLLLLLPEKDKLELAAKFSRDTHGYVLKAVERARNQEIQKQRKRAAAKRDFSLVADRLARMEQKYGKGAARSARQIADRLLCLTIGGVVHDMRGLLSRLTSKAETLRYQADSGIVDLAQFRKALREMAERLHLLERYVNDVHTYSGQVTLESRPERLVYVVTEACDIARDRVLASGRDPDDVLMVIAVSPYIGANVTRYLVATALANIILNAFDALALRSDGARIEISAKVVDDDVEITVRDNGMGLYEDDLRELRQFAPGWTTKKGKGTGFGLPIANRNVTAHGGRMEIESRPGEGTTVKITLLKNTRPSNSEDAPWHRRHS
jgi:signal transduction histidine kinase